MASACFTTTEPLAPYGGQPFEPPPQFELWWSMVEDCVGHARNLDGVAWFTLPGQRTFQVRGGTYSGYAWQQPDRILLGDGLLSAGSFVRHEMLHLFMSRSGHPAMYFGNRCAGVVMCAGECAAEASVPEPPLSAPTIPLSSLAVALRVLPDQPSAARFGGWFALVVEVHNPRDHAVWVDLEPTGPGSPFGKTFGFTSAGGATYLFDEDLRMGFGPRETKRFVFDIDPAYGGWTDEEVEVQGFFGSNLAPTVRVRVMP